MDLIFMMASLHPTNLFSTQWKDFFLKPHYSPVKKPKYGNSPNDPRLMNGLTVVHLHNGILLSNKKE